MGGREITLTFTFIRKIPSAITYACPVCEFVAETNLLKLQHLQNKVLRTIGNFPRNASVRDIHVTFKIPYVYDYVTKLCRQQVQVIQNHEYENVRNIGQSETRHRKYKMRKLAGDHINDRSRVLDCCGSVNYY
jgi:hypothetical protein